MEQKIIGTHSVGPLKAPSGAPWRNAPLSVEVPFPAAFSSPPVVIVSTLQDPKWTGPINDTFATTVTGVTKTGFTVHIVRVDTVNPDYVTYGWDQNLQLSYMAEVPA
ncbi:H-type lectin domain-containing protein [Paraburkholderia sp. EG304]|uniref:H-type lectin domain-containing protein n=1 Tax=Paraburkholderia sp. EG304 TaxID=3237015 RepID=UPI00397A6185